MFSIFRTKTSSDMASDPAAHFSTKRSKLPVRPWPFLASASKHALPRKSCPAALLANPNFAEQTGRVASAKVLDVDAVNNPTDHILQRNSSECDSESSTGSSGETSPALSPTAGLMFAQGFDHKTEVRRQESNALAEYGLDITVGTGKY